MKPALMLLAGFLIVAGTLTTFVPSMVPDLFRADEAMTVSSFLRNTDYGYEVHPDSRYVLNADRVWSGNITEYFDEIGSWGTWETQGEELFVLVLGDDTNQEYLDDCLYYYDDCITVYSTTDFRSRNGRWEITSSFVQSTCELRYSGGSWSPCVDSEALWLLGEGPDPGPEWEAAPFIGWGTTAIGVGILVVIIGAIVAGTREVYRPGPNEGSNPFRARPPVMPYQMPQTWPQQFPTETAGGAAGVMPPPPADHPSQ